MKKEEKTNVMRVLDGKKISYMSHSYEPDATMSGAQIAGILGEPAAKMWDTCDVIITANPNILSAKPEGKISVKIESTYNNDSEADFTYATMEELMADKEGDFMKKLEQWKKEG